MKAKVMAIFAEHEYRGSQELIELHFTGAHPLHHSVRIPNTLNLQLRDEVEVEFTLLPSIADLDAAAAEQEVAEKTR